MQKNTIGWVATIKYVEEQKKTKSSKYSVTTSKSLVHNLTFAHCEQGMNAVLMEAPRSKACVCLPLEAGGLQNSVPPTWVIHTHSF